MFERALKEGLKFGCTGCSQCCTGSPGYVWLSTADILGLAGHFQTAPRDFLGRYCIRARVGEGYGFSLKEKADNACILLEQGKCTAYAARPVQCRTYPFWDAILESETSWRGESAYCPGIDKGEPHSPEDIAEALIQSRKNAREACGGAADVWRENAQ
jgi:Fe-S-cluster containining protein